MTQEIIIEMDHKYPFASIQYYSPDMKVYVRRILPFTRENYKILKNKLDLTKRLNNANLITLIKVLQQDNKFHLIYEYVPYRLQQAINLTPESINNLKTKLLFLSSFLHFNRIATKFSLLFIGMDNKMELKYFLDINFDIIQHDHELVKNRYLSQIGKITDTLMASFDTAKMDQKKLSFNPEKNLVNANKKEKGKQFINSKGTVLKSPKMSDIVNNKRGQEKRQERRDRSNQKSIISSKSNAFNILSNIEQKLDMLTSSMKKHPKNPSFYQLNKAEHKKKQLMKNSSIFSQLQDEKNFDGESVREKTKKFKTEHRKYSGQVNIITPFVKKVKAIEKTKSVNNQKGHGLEKIHENTEQQNYRKQSQQSKMLQSEKKSQDTMKSLKIKQPTNKNDFEQMKKYEFENFFNSKQKYVHQFLGILDDEISTKVNYSPNYSPSNSNLATPYGSTSNLIQTSYQRTQKSLKQQSENLRKLQNTMLGYSSNSTITHRRHANENRFFSPGDPFQEKRRINNELKQRISKAILKSDQALLKYRKLSTHSNEFKVIKK